MVQIQDFCGHLYVFNSVEFDYSYQSIYRVDPETQELSRATLLYLAVFYLLFFSSQTCPVNYLKSCLRVFWVMEFKYNLLSMIQQLPE